MTECLVRSINKFTPNSSIYIFDNSDKEPFTYRTDNLVYIDNTKGAVVDFDAFLNKHRGHLNTTRANVNNYGSIKHSLSIQKAFDLFDDGFILLDSDVLLKKNVADLADDRYIFVGGVSNSFGNTYRVLPYACYINVRMCKERGVSFFNENYMYGLEYTPESVRYDTGGYFYKATEGIPRNILNVKRYVAHYLAGSWLDDAKGKHGYRPIYTVSEFLYKNKKLWCNEMEKKKKVIYTCITGGYELLDDPFEISPDYDYVCFTNFSQIRSRIWKIRPIPAELDGLSEVKKQRCIKIMPHKFLPEYDFSIWVDGNIKLMRDVNSYVEKNCVDGSIFIPEHPVRKCIYREMEICMRIKKDTAENILPMKRWYKQEGFPANFGLVQSGIIFRWHHDPGCVKLMEDWWGVLKDHSHRDQLSFDYVRWKNPDVPVKFLDKNIFRSPWFYGKRHNKPTGKPVESKPEFTHNIIPVDGDRVKTVVTKPAPRPERKVEKKPEAKYRSRIISANELAKRREISDRLRAFIRK